MGKQTPFYPLHVQAKAKIVDFAGWDMPLHYGSQLEEHHQVRKHGGFFDVSHMGIVDLQGPQATSYLRHLLANNVDKLTPQKALYTCLLNEAGGVIDDLIVYQLSTECYRLVVNAGTCDKDLAWFREHAASFDVELTLPKNLAMIAVQGPRVRELIPQFINPAHVSAVSALKPFTFVALDDWFIAATGYTGEAGFEIILPADQVSLFWEKLVLAGIKPCGLGARDTLRLEAGLNLYGSDMDEAVTPLESNLSWTVAWEPEDRQFIGRSALEKQKIEGVKMELVGLLLEGSGIIRNHQSVWCDGKKIGEVTSGGYSPTLEKSIALARIAKGVSNCFVEIRNKQVPAAVVKLPFVRKGQPVFERSKA